MLAVIPRPSRSVRFALRARAVRIALVAGFGCASLIFASTSYAWYPGPYSTSPPKITGIAQQGQTLSEVHGSWSHWPWPESPTSFTYQWLRCKASGVGCAPIAGATAQTYVVVAEDVGHTLQVQEAAGTAGDSGSLAQSAPTGVVVPPVPTNTARPTITGTAQQGQTLLDVHGSWTNSPTSFTYQWLRCKASGVGCAPIAGATAQTYVVVAKDVGHTLQVQETAGNAGGSGSPAQSAPTNVRLAALVITANSVIVNRRDEALVPARCPARIAGGCRGTITIRLDEPTTRSVRVVAARCGRGCRPIGSGRYEARAGRRLDVRVHIASYVRRLLTGRRTRRATLTVASFSEGQAATVVRTVTLKA